MVALLDLKQVNATTLSFDVACRVSDKMRIELEKLTGGPLKVGGGWGFGILRRKNGNEWVDYARFDYSEEGGPHLHITFIYGSEDIPHPPRGVRKPYQLLQIIGMADESLTFACESSFLYKDGVEKSIIRLPISIFRTKKVDFHDIKGVELSCTEPEESKYNIVIRVNEEGSLEHNITFDFTTKAVPMIAHNILKKALKISQHFLE